MGQITPQPGIMGIELYQSGASKAAGVVEPLKLSANENPFGPSPKAKAAAAAALDKMHRYPGTDHGDLRRAIAEVHGLEADNIICGVGSDEILSLLAYAYAGPGDEVVHTEHGFAIYDIVARAAGAVPVVAPERDRVTDVDAILAACTDKTRLVFIANPNNPTATMIGGNEVARLADGLPPQALLVLDGAYAEFAPGYDGGAALVAQRDNVVMTRTFSKLYGLGGLRIGWGYAPREIIDVLNRLRGPFNLSAMQMAAAEAAVRDQDYAQDCLAENARLRVVLAEGLAAQGISCDTSLANFVLARFASEAEAQACNAHLLAEGIIVRPVASYGLPHCLRMTVGSEDQCARLLAAVAGFRAAQG